MSSGYSLEEGLTAVGTGPEEPEQEDPATFAPLFAEIGSRIRAARQAAGLSQRQLAESVGLKQGYITGVESGGGNPTVRTLARLADALRVPIGSLFPALPDAPPSDAAVARLSATLERLEPLLRDQEKNGQLASEALGQLAEMQVALARATKPKGN